MERQQCKPRSDCSFTSRSSLIWVCTICSGRSVPILRTFTLKVDSCPNNDYSVRTLFCPFLCRISIIYALNLLLPRKPQDFAENLHFYVCLFPLCWNSDSKNIFVTCPQVVMSFFRKFFLVMGSPGGQGMVMGKHYP